MSSADQGIIKSVDVVIGAIKDLENEIRRTPDVDPDVKVLALQKVELVSDSLKDIHTTFYIPDELKTTLDFSGDEATVTDLSSTMISALSGLGDGQPTETDALSETATEEMTATAEEELDDEVVEDPVGMRLVVRSQSEKSEGSEKSDKVDEDLAALVDELVDKFEDEADLEEDEADLEDGVEIAASGELEDKILQTDIVSPKVNNLLLIMGIDEKIESLLNDYDIFRFEDIAGFQEADVVRISKLLDDPARVSRENWIEQASLLAQDVPTKFAQQVAGIELFDRMSLVGAYHGTLVQDEILEDMPVFEVPEYGPVQEEELLPEDSVVLEDEVLVASDPIEDVVEPAPLPVDSISLEKQLLEAELASLRLELAERTAAVEQKILDDAKSELDAELGTEVGTELGVSDETIVEEVSSSELSARLQNAFTGPLTGEEFAEAEDGLSDDGSELKLDIPLIFDVDVDQQIVLADDDNGTDTSEDEVGDGAMWHDEVSTSADYVPPVINDMDDDLDSDLDSDFDGDFEAGEPVSFDHSGEFNDVPENSVPQNGSSHLDDDYLDGSDISVPLENTFLNGHSENDIEPVQTAETSFEDGSFEEESFEGGVFANGMPPLVDAVPPVFPPIFGDGLESENLVPNGMEHRDVAEFEAPLMPPVPFDQVTGNDVHSGNQVTQQDQMALAEMAQAMDLAQDGDMPQDRDMAQHGADPLFDTGVSQPLGAYLAGQQPVGGVEEQAQVPVPDLPVTQLLQNGRPPALPVRSLGGPPNGLPPRRQNGVVHNGPPVAPVSKAPVPMAPMAPPVAPLAGRRPPQSPVMPPHGPSSIVPFGASVGAPQAGVGFPPPIQQVPYAPQIPQTRRIANGEPPLQGAPLLDAPMHSAELQRSGPNNLLPPVQRSKRPGERDDMAGEPDHHMPRYQKENRDPQVSAGFKLKAKQFSESLQRSFVSEED